MSQGYVKEQFAWQHLYFTLMPEGVVYLRQYLGLPEDVFPATHKYTRDQIRPIHEEKVTRGGRFTIFSFKFGRKAKFLLFLFIPRSP